MIFNIHGGNPFPAEVRLLYRWSIVHLDDEVPAEGTLLFVNRSPSRLIPKGRGRPCTAGQLFTVTMHSHAAEVRVYTPAWSIVHPDDAFPA